MRRSNLKHFFLASLLSAAAVAAVAWEDREVPARRIPVPLTESAAMQKIIAEPPSQVPPAPKTAAEWEALQKALDAKWLTDVHEGAQKFGIRITQQTIAGVNCYLIEPRTVKKENENRLLVNVHGGAFVIGAGEAGLGEALVVAHYTQSRVLAIDYRMPPRFPFPAAVDDATAVWKRLLEKHDASRMALFGTSAGGNLTMATVLKLKSLGLALPAATFVGSPASDIRKVGDTLFTNANVDNVIVTYDGFIDAALKLYANGHDMQDPLLSPINGDLRGFPPTIFFSGTRDLLLSSTIRAHRALRAVGVAADLHVYEGQSHAQFLRYGTPEGDDALREIGGFFDRYLKR